MRRHPLRAMVSIHDLMPATRIRVSHMLDELREQVPQLQPAHITLLVVPGCDWRDEDLDWLRGLARSGHPMAGHGWRHQAVGRDARSRYHRLHSALLSRNVAEHLSRPEDELVELVRDCASWFPQQGLPAPTLYVPPAWALGRTPARAWQNTSFTMVETLSGVSHCASGRHRRLPLTGYEADHAGRAIFLALFNRWNLWRARLSGVPVRIGLHPFDLGLSLSGSVIDHLKEVDRFEDYDQLWREDAQPSWSSR